VTEERRGILFGLSAYLMWGLFPLYWPLLEPASPLEILGNRVVWSLVFVATVLLVRRRWTWVGALRADYRRLGVLAVAAAVISVNWGLYIWGVNNGHVVETSLGYFINPLVTVLIGVLLLGERLRRGQWVAVAIAALAVVVLTVAYGRPPWLALALAASFATYGLAKKKVGMPAIESLGVETALLALPALAVLVVLQVRHTAAFGHTAQHVTWLLVGSGVVTAIPLILFGAAAPRIPLSTIGLLQYVTPIMQFVLGLTVFHEAMPASRWIGFVLVWVALALFSIDSVRAAQSRAYAADGTGEGAVGGGPELAPSPAGPVAGR
jgi:chloramphenicol-sensitive protein RarD